MRAATALILRAKHFYDFVLKWCASNPSIMPAFSQNNSHLQPHGNRFATMLLHPVSSLRK
jgi:hypothetical protein